MPKPPPFPTGGFCVDGDATRWRNSHPSAAAVCRACPVTARCLDRGHWEDGRAGTTYGATTGTYGALTAAERATARKADSHARQLYRAGRTHDRVNQEPTE